MSSSPYDSNARRSIAALLANRQAAQAQAEQPQDSPQGKNAWRDYWVKNYGADPNNPFFQGTEDWSQTPFF